MSSGIGPNPANHPDTPDPKKRELKPGQWIEDQPGWDGSLGDLPRAVVGGWRKIFGADDRRVSSDNGIMWVPKFHGDPGIVARDSRAPLPDPAPWNPWENFTGQQTTRESNEYVGSRFQKSYVVTDENKVMKITQLHDGRWQVVWTRWRA